MKRTTTMLAGALASQVILFNTGCSSDETWREDNDTAEFAVATATATATATGSTTSYPDGGSAPVCPSGYAQCDGERAYCTSLAADSNNCGSCGMACAAGELCIAGACEAALGRCLHETEVCMSRPKLKKGVVTCTYTVAYSLHDAPCSDTFNQRVCDFSADGTACERDDAEVDCNTSLPD